ncbi:hypothetical protein EXIGLDRAFT_767859 [Exidia glandulosa HHB12029]|uniref:Uncharacterized protein n=1 Tax=Exidia glandulosa HHB12029 TaxID=1314781 RepID=A0A165IN74_EXIGL|nr:hypothetical protein EXIGLDRAFT_767859 [Exidia glandulosa HHB12029]
MVVRDASWSSLVRVQRHPDPHEISKAKSRLLVHQNSNISKCQESLSVVQASAAAESQWYHTRCNPPGLHASRAHPLATKNASRRIRPYQFQLSMLRAYRAQSRDALGILIDILNLTAATTRASFCHTRSLPLPRVYPTSRPNHVARFRFDYIVEFSYLDYPRITPSRAADVD